MDHSQMHQLFAWPELRANCGKQAVAWTRQDEYHANMQRLHADLIERPALEDMHRRDIADARYDERKAMQDQQRAEQTIRDARIMENVRAISRRPNTTNNVTLCMQVFGVQYSGAIKMCEAMGLDPKKAGK